MTEFGIVLVTVDTQEMAQAIAQALVSDRLAACVNLFPIHSVYTWAGQVEQAAEWQLVIKTDLQRFADLEQAINEIHPYEVPEVIAIHIVQGAQPYLAWLQSAIAPSTASE